jgi:hypothetical protein
MENDNSFRREADGGGATAMAAPNAGAPLPNFSGSNAGPDEATRAAAPNDPSPRPAQTLAESEDDGGGRLQNGAHHEFAAPVKIRRRPLKLPDMSPEETVGRLVEEGRRWNDVVRAHQRLVLQAKAICRRFVSHASGELSEADLKRVRNAGAELFDQVVKGECDDVDVALVVAPFLQAMEPFERQRGDIEQMIATLTRKLPVWNEWGENVFGVSALWFGLVIGEAGDISRFSNPAKLWKRMGMAVIGGERQRKKADAEAAAEHGFTPRRRSCMWNVGNGLIGGMGRGPRPLVGEDIEARSEWSPYQRVFVARLRYEAERDPSHARPATKDGKESFSKHAAARAKRYVEKRFLRDLWRAWRRMPAWEQDTSIEFRSAA